MNFLFFHESELKDSTTAEVVGDRAIYVNEFHKLKAGDRTRAILHGVGGGSAECLSVEREKTTFRVQFQEAGKVYFPITLVQGLSRPQTVKKVLQFGAMFRVERIVFVPTSLGEKSYLHSKMMNGDEQMYELIKGLEQVGNPFPPEVLVLSKFRDLTNLEFDHRRKFIALPSDGVGSLSGILLKQEPFPAECLLAVGPEVGWSDEEVDWYCKKGFQQLSLGPDQLRVEVALVSLLSQLSLWKDLSLGKASELPTLS